MTFYRHGFTLIELMVVVAIIAVITALFIPAMGMILRKRRQLETAYLIDGMTLAMNKYINHWGVCGDQRDATASDFSDKPLFFLVQRPVKGGLDPYVADLDPNHIVDAANAGLRSMEEAESVRDSFGQLLRFTIKNDWRTGTTSGPYHFTKEIEIRSLSGTIDDVGDDFGKKWEVRSKEWRDIIVTPP